MSAVKKWLEVVANPPRCCLSCRHYLADSWSPSNECTVHKAAPPREWAEEENTCESWEELVPF